MSDATIKDAELARIADAYFQEEPCSCPRDGTRLAVEELAYVGRRTVDLSVRCPRCGKMGEYRGVEPDRDIKPWEPDDRAAIVDEYWRNKVARCPLDRSLLRIDEVREASRITPLHVRCVRCGRSFFSDEVTLGTSSRDRFEGRFAEVEALAEGGMGRVSLVRERNSGDFYVAKEIKPQIADSAGLARFEREIRLLQGLAHPNVVRIVADFFSPDRALFVMEHLAGGHLGSLINDNGVPVVRLVKLFADTVAGVEYLHEHGIVHRDLKPKNILLGADGHARVSDLGLALDPGTETLTQPGTFVGSPLYMAPEQRSRAHDVSPQADIYPLALIAYEIARRQSPYVQPVVLEEVPPPLASAIRRGLEVDPIQRNVTARELARALEAALDDATGVPRPSANGSSDLTLPLAAGTAGPDVTRNDLPAVATNPNAEFTQLGAVPRAENVDGELAKLGYRRTGARGFPRKGDLYLGRGWGGDERGIYLREKDPPPEGFSGADIFELLERLR
jgi:tRNA A-37 threonylcarbamoyl transferase component Bud32/ribosomal protein L37E